MIKSKANDFRRFGLVLVTAFIIGFTWATSAWSAGVYSFPLFYKPASLDVLKDDTVDLYNIINQIYDGLVAFDPNLNVVPGLAESWTVSRDGLEYRFQLRAAIMFHNGKELTAMDVVASLNRVFEKSKKKLPARFIDSVTAKTEKAVVIRLSEPYAPFLATLAMPLTRIIPSEYAENDEPLGERPVGTGPFRFESWEGEVITLKANDRYFNGRPALDELRFVFYPKGEREKAFQDFLEGTLDGCPLPSSANPVMLKEKGYQIFIRPRLSLLYYGMNIDYPPLGDPRIRKAIALASNQVKHVTEDLGGNYIPALQIMPRGMPGYTPDNALLGYDPDTAARLLTEAGYPKGEGIPELIFASASQSDFAKKELNLFAEDMAKIGIRIKTVFVDDWEKFKTDLGEKKYSLFRYATYADIPHPEDLLAVIVESGSPSNFTGFSNEKVDTLLGVARAETDPIQRTNLYREAERLALEDAPIVPVLFITSQVVFQKGIEGINLPALGTPYMSLRTISLSE